MPAGWYIWALGSDYPSLRFWFAGLMLVGFFFRPRFCDSSVRAPRDFVFMVLISPEILFLGFGLRFCRCALYFTIVFGFYLWGAQWFRMGFVLDDSVSAYGARLCFLWFWGNWISEFFWARDAACLCFMDPDENGIFRLESRYVHDTSRELTVAAITRRGESATCWIRGPSTGQRPSTILNPGVAWILRTKFS